MNRIKHFFQDFVQSIVTTENTANVITDSILFILTIILLLLVDFCSRKIIIKIFTKFSVRSRTKFDDIILTNKVPRNLAHIIPLLIAFELFPVIFEDFSYTNSLILKILRVYGIFLTLWVVRGILNSLKDYFKTRPRLKDKPVDSYIQVFMIFSWSIGIILAFAVITDKSIWKFITALGAVSAVIILVFRDTILGFVASIQVSINDMVRIGDWITFDKYGADGDVIEINLATVKIQNFDKTITTIPTYALISDSFKNWKVDELNVQFFSNKVVFII